MKRIIQQIISAFGEEIYSIKEIIGLGSVNRIFDIKSKNKNYIIRLNEESQKEIEYKKEKWCIEKVSSIGIPSPKILKLGFKDGISYMIQEKIHGKNGKNCTSKEKEKIWNLLGVYASKFHQIKRIENKEVEEQEFHDSWKSRLKYNLEQLNKEDSLLKNGILNPDEHSRAKEELSKLIGKEFKTGLIHGDLCPKNVIWSKKSVYLLDWGTASINIIPHHELGLVMTSGEANIEEIEFFKKGYGISNKNYQQIANEIRIINFLHRLDIYRWAKDYAIEEIEEYENKIRETYEKLN